MAAILKIDSTELYSQVSQELNHLIWVSVPWACDSLEEWIVTFVTPQKSTKLPAENSHFEAQALPASVMSDVLYIILAMQLFVVTSLKNVYMMYKPLHIPTFAKQ